MHIGFIGLGAMGRAMALNLLRAGHTLSLWARRTETLAPFLSEAGVQVCATPAALARDAAVVFTSLTGSPDVEAVALGPDGLCEGFAPGALLVDMSSITPATSRRISAALATQGVDMLDAPVSGGVQGATEGSLVIMVGGALAALERVRPLLAALGQQIVHCGEPGAGQVTKLCNQMLLINTIQAVAEALHLASAAGVDPGKVRDALAGGSAGSRVLEVSGRRMVERRFTEGMVAATQHKDFGALLAEAQATATPLPVAGVVAQQLNALMARGWGEEDTAQLLRLLE